MLKKRIAHLWSVAAFMAVMGFGGFTFAGDLEPGTAPAPTMHTLDEIYDAVTGGGANSAVPKSGQTTSFATGDDGNLEKGIAWPNPRFTDNLDGTITDNLTHLIWDKDANRFGTRNWNAALSDCNNLADNGGNLTDGSAVGDWHLANVKEYKSLIHYGVFNPAVPDTNGTGQWSQSDPFNNVQSLAYWSSTTVAGNTADAWFMGFGNGVVDGGFGKGSGLFVWCVRGGQ
ncbi:MAG: DUF1566 domain-containing protein [Planctomycetes bacterium]|nr:DUF1566 domain-containing protein [Planctomycetota bacterium]